jgi:hypothetical protein
MSWLRFTYDIEIASAELCCGAGTRGGSVPYNTDPPRSRPGGWAYPGEILLRSRSAEITLESQALWIRFLSRPCIQER